MASTRGESKLAQYKSHWHTIHQKQDRQQGLLCILSADNTNCNPAETLPRAGVQHTEKARVSPCPWGHRQAGSLRLE